MPRCGESILRCCATTLKRLELSLRSSCTSRRTEQNLARITLNKSEFYFADILLKSGSADISHFILVELHCTTILVGANRPTSKAICIAIRLAISSNTIGTLLACQHGLNRFWLRIGVGSGVGSGVGVSVLLHELSSEFVELSIGLHATESVVINAITARVTLFIKRVFFILLFVGIEI